MPYKHDTYEKPAKHIDCMWVEICMWVVRVVIKNADKSESTK
jgi:hypothetical protein